VQKAAEELVDVQREQFLGVAVRIVAIAEADPLAVKRDDPELLMAMRWV